MGHQGSNVFLFGLLCKPPKMFEHATRLPFVTILTYVESETQHPCIAIKMANGLLRSRVSAEEFSMFCAFKAGLGVLLNDCIIWRRVFGLSTRILERFAWEKCQSSSMLICFAAESLPKSFPCFEPLKQDSAFY